LVGDEVRPFVLVFAANGASRSPFMVGVVLAAGVLPQLALLPLGGAWGDARHPTRTLVVADVVRAASLVVCAAAWARGIRSVELLIVTQLICAASGAFFAPAAGRLLVALSEHDRLFVDNARVAVAGYVGEMAGPAAAAVLLALGGPSAAIGFDGLTFFVSAVLLSRVRTPAQIPSRRVAPHRRMRRVLSRSPIRALLGVEASWALLGAAPILVLGPVVCMTRLDGPASWAAIVTAYGVGGVLGGILVRSSVIARRHAALGFLLETPAPLLLAFGATTWLVAATAVVGGMGSAATTALLTTSLQLHTPPRLQATTAALHEAVELALLSIGYLAAGPISSATSTPIALSLSAATGIVLTAVTQRIART
jgi:MFS family permease